MVNSRSKPKSFTAAVYATCLNGVMIDQLSALHKDGCRKVYVAPHNRWNGHGAILKQYLPLPLPKMRIILQPKNVKYSEDGYLMFFARLIWKADYIVVMLDSSNRDSKEIAAMVQRMACIRKTKLIN